MFYSILVMCMTYDGKSMCQYTAAKKPFPTYAQCEDQSSYAVENEIKPNLKPGVEATFLCTKDSVSS